MKKDHEFSKKKKSNSETETEKAGKEFGDEIGRTIGNFFESFGKTFGSVIAIIVNVVFFIILNKYHSKIPFVTEEITNWLPYVNTSIFVTIVGQSIFLVVSNKVVRDLLQSIMDVFGLISLVKLYMVFPFDFTEISAFEWLRGLTKIGIIFVIAAMTIGIIVRMIKLASDPINIKKKE